MKRQSQTPMLATPPLGGPAPVGAVAIRAIRPAIRTRTVAVALAAFASLLIATGECTAQTPAGVVNGCQFGPCNLPTSQCCSLASQQLQACEQTDAANRPNYPAHGQPGARAEAAISECTRCSRVYVRRFCAQ